MVRRKNFRGRLEDNTPNPVDIHVGNRMRLRRQILHMTQIQLADKLGLTFQQVQKYEKGANRIGASRLWDIAQVLSVSTDFFFQDMDVQTAALSPRKKTAEEEYEPLYDDPLHREKTLALVRNFYKINNRKIAQLLFDLMEQNAHTSSKE